MGGILFMSILSIEFAGVLFFAGKALMSKHSSTALIQKTGLLAAVTGIFGQLIGLFSAFEAIQQMGSVSPAMLAGGLKVSMITTMYGLVIYLIALILSLVIKWKNA